MEHLTQELNLGHGNGHAEYSTWLRVLRQGWLESHRQLLPVATPHRLCVPSGRNVQFIGRAGSDGMKLHCILYLVPKATPGGLSRPGKPWCGQKPLFRQQLLFLDIFRQS